MSAPESISSATRAERILAAIHLTCSHDLPNQLLSLKSLLHLVALEEGVPPSLLEYLARLNTVADKTGHQIEFLRDAVRLSRHTPRIEDLHVSALLQELKARIRTMLPAVTLEWEIRLQSEVIPGDYDLVLQGLTDLVSLLAGPLSNRDGVVMVASTPGTLEVYVRPTLVLQGWDKQPMFLLARERLHAAGIALRTLCSPGIGIVLVTDLAAG